MKKLLGVSLVAMMTLLGSTAIEAATTTGDAQVELVTPLSIAAATVGSDLIDFGTVAIDGAGTITMDTTGGGIICDTPGDENFSCPSSGTMGDYIISGQTGTNVTVTASSTTLGDGVASTIAFVPALNRSGPFALAATDEENHILIGGELTIVGDEAAGTYTTGNGGGSFTLEVLY